MSKYRPSILFREPLDRTAKRRVWKKGAAANVSVLEDEMVTYHRRASDDEPTACCVIVGEHAGAYWVGDGGAYDDDVVCRCWYGPYSELDDARREAVVLADLLHEPAP